MKHDESSAVKLPIGFPFLICGILANQKKDIMTSDEEVGVVSCVLNFSYKVFVMKHIVDVVLHTPVDYTNLSINE